MVDEVLEAYSAGSPTDEAVRWTDLEPVQLSQQVLAGAGYRRRSLRKALISGDVDPHERDRQFRLIATLRRQARARGVPALYVDLTFDAGAANVARSLRFKEDLVALSRRFGRRLQVALYPPYTSKWHPIEHRLIFVIKCITCF